jgi:hypothetical protein
LDPCSFLFLFAKHNLGIGSGGCHWINPVPCKLLAKNDGFFTAVRAGTKAALSGACFDSRGKTANSRGNPIQGDNPLHPPHGEIRRKPADRMT